MYIFKTHESNIPSIKIYMTKFREHFAHKCKISGGVFDHNRKQLTEKFNGGGELINVMQF